MKRVRPFIGIAAAWLFGGCLTSLQSQTPSQAPAQSVEKQVRALYRITRVGTEGNVVGDPGVVLEIQQDGLLAIPASYEKYWDDNLKAGHIRSPFVQQHGGMVGLNDRRALQVGEKVYVVYVQFNETDISFFVQTCGECNSPNPDPSNPPYRARLAVDFGKGYTSTITLKTVQDTVAQAFTIDSAPTFRAPAPLAPPPAPVALRFPSTYTSAQSPGDQIQLNADYSFSLQEGGESYHGTFTVQGNTLELNIKESNTKTTATLQGNSLTDSSGQTWTLRDQPAGSAGSAPAGPVLQNADIIKMVKAGFDDALITTKISSSKCQFDTSTDALIQLKQNGVSPAIIKAMLAGGK